MSLHKTLFYLLILLVPTQLSRHFWPDWSFVSGIRLDYLSPTIYLTDIIIVTILVAWIKNKLKTPQILYYLTSDRLFVIKVFCVLLFLILNVFVAQNKPVAIIKFLKLTELFLLVLYIKENIAISQYRNIAILFSLTVLYSSLLAWLQFIKQSSLGGIFWLLGERNFTVITPGIATAVLNGKMLLRPYATFPHPNVLAGYLTVLLPLLFFRSSLRSASWRRVLELLKPRIPAPPTRGRRPREEVRVVRGFLLLLTLSTILITFSRSAWVTATLILFAALLYYKSKRVGYFIPDRLSTNPLFVSLFLLFIILLSPLLFSRLHSLTTTDRQTLIFRRELNRAAIEMIKDHPLIGVGLNNFLPQLPNYRPIKTYQNLQPAHNIYLLIAAETGLVGLGIFLFLILKAYQKLISKSEFLISNQIPNPKSQLGHWGIGNCLGQLGIRSIRNLTLLLSLTSILLLGLTDHYFFTLQQTQLLFAIILGLVYVQTPQTLNLPRPRPCS